MSLGAQNAVVGDEFGIDLPVTEVKQEELVREKQMAKFSKSKEYQILKEYLQDRIKFYQTRLPDGTPIVDGPLENISTVDWRVANLIVAEFQSVLDAYENAQTVVSEKK